MAHNVGVFVDVSNLFYSAKSAGVEVNYCGLLEQAVAGRDLIRACAYTGVDPENPNQRKFIDFLKSNGYKVVCKDIHKYEGGRIKANLDIEMAVDILLLSENLDVVVIVSGDGDFVRLVEAVQMKGVRCEVIAFGISTSNELIEAADSFTEIGTLPGIFRNGVPGPGVHIRSSQVQSESRQVYAYTSYSVSAGFGLPLERVSGEKERERLRAAERGAHGGYLESRDDRNRAEAAPSTNGQTSAYNHATHDEFMLPDAEPCVDPHSIPVARLETDKTPDDDE
ncbi:MAG TPA: NYN domain-containing protein [Chloroflexota bacterium]|nr:NYN domain-containing protein [Chloroflexota bacterium]